MRKVSGAALLAVGMAMAAPATAQSLIGTTASASNNSYQGSLSNINDGVYPVNGTLYTSGTVHDYNQNETFTLAFTGGLTTVGYFNVNVDNNDDYTVTLFNDTAGTSLARTITAAQGVVGGGTENFTSNAALSGTYTYLPTLAFAPFAANRATITSAGGDRNFAIGEAQFFTTAATGAVPEPATWGMMIIGVGVVGAMRRRQVAARRVTYAV